MIRRAMLVSCVLGVSWSLEACAEKSKPIVAVAPGSIAPRIETRVYARRQCVLSSASDKPEGAEFFGALATIFIPTLVEKGLGAVSSALKKAGAEETQRELGRLPTTLYRLQPKSGAKARLALNPDLGCVIAVRGRFLGPDEPGQQSKVVIGSPGIFLDPGQEKDRIKRLNDSGIPVQDIALAYEAAVLPSDDGTGLRYESRFLEVNEFQGTRASDRRGLIVSLAMFAVGSKEDENTLSLALINLGEVAKKSIFGPDLLKSRRSGWLGGIGINEASLKAIETIAVGDRSLGIMPITIEAMIAETENGNKTLRFIADVLDATKTDVSKAVLSELGPDERKKRTEEAADALGKQLSAEEEAFLAYLTAQDELDQVAPDKPMQKRIKEFQVEAKKRAWCLKFGALQKLGIAPTRSGQCP